MEWIKETYSSKTGNMIHDIVDAKSGGRADEFLHGTDKTYTIQNLDVCAEWIRYFVQNQVGFYIVGDYDCDGITATASLQLLLETLKATILGIHIPDRADGYGLSAKIIREMPSPGVIITVDNGITAFEAIDLARQNGHTVIVTDHHQPKTDPSGSVVLPHANLIIDPHVPDNTIALGPVVQTAFREYCGAGLVYKLASLLIPEKKYVLSKIAALCAIGTVGDVVPLVEDNRNIYADGAKAIQKNHIPHGLMKILDRLNLGKNITETDLSFRISPLLNAPGRVLEKGGPYLSLQALLEEDYKKAAQTAAKLFEVNERRKEFTKKGCAAAAEMIETQCLYGNSIVIYNNSILPGITGLVASNVSEKYGCAAIVFSDDPRDPEALRASARSNNGLSLVNILTAVSISHPEYIITFGGHHEAAGVTVRRKYLTEFTDAVSGISEKAVIKSRDTEGLHYDCEIEAGVLRSVAEEVMKYAPYGAGNPSIKLRVKNFKLVPKQNMFYSISGDNVFFSGAGFEAAGFGLAQKYIDFHYPMEVEMIGEISYRNYGTTPVPQIQILDLRAVKREAASMPQINKSIFDSLRANGLTV